MDRQTKAQVCFYSYGKIHVENVMLMHLREITRTPAWTIENDQKEDFVLNILRTLKKHIYYNNNKSGFNPLCISSWKL